MPAPLKLTTSPEFIAALGTADDPIIAAQFGVSPNTVKNHRDKHGVESYRSVRRAEVKRLLAEGCTDSAVQRDTGMDRRAVARLREKMGVLNPYNVKAESTTDTILAYRDDHPDASPYQISDALGIAHSWVRVVLKRHPE